MLSFQPQQNGNGNGNGGGGQGESSGGTPALRLRDDPPPITPATRNNRKRKSPPNPDPIQHVLPPPHALIHPIPPSIPPYSYPPADYSPAGLAPSQPPQQSPSVPQPTSPSQSAAGRTLSQSKRAEQNRKAQRAFRERRDQHVKALESRSQLLDAALASADEANRRWEECRALVDQLRVENAALRAALSQTQLLSPTNPITTPAALPTSNTVHETVVSGIRDDKTLNLVSGEEGKQNDPRTDVKTSTQD